ncbi:MAG: PTS sugar transporter [Deltaproteobacteria bacterium]|jgi:PTS system mannose-specific IIA component|nr:PTS sugar transporter [Deltaproteobacteria bacterium]
MIGIIIVTHNTLASTLVATAEKIVGPLEQVRAIDIDNSCQNVESIQQQLGETINAMKKEGLQVLIATDMFGGTPSNISLSFFEPEKVEIISGVNLPMILKLASERQQRELGSLAKFITEYGRKNIFSATEFLGQ